MSVPYFKKKLCILCLIFLIMDYDIWPKCSCIGEMMTTGMFSLLVSPHMGEIHLEMINCMHDRKCSLIGCGLDIDYLTLLCTAVFILLLFLLTRWQLFIHGRQMLYHLAYLQY